MYLVLRKDLENHNGGGGELVFVNRLRIFMSVIVTGSPKGSPPYSGGEVV